MTSPNAEVDYPPKLSNLQANAHLLANILLILPLSSFLAFPIYVELYNIPYLGVFPLVLIALNNAFSAPRIWIVDAGYLLKFVNEPAWDINLAPTNSPTIDVKFGAIVYILLVKYSNNLCLNEINLFIFNVKFLILNTSKSFNSIPIDIFADSIISLHFSSSPTNLFKLSTNSSWSWSFNSNSFSLVSNYDTKPIII